MHVIVDDRVEQTLRHVPQHDAERIFKFMEQLENQNVAAFRAHRDVSRLRGKDRDAFIIRVTRKLRIICRWIPQEQALYMEDVVSADVLDRYLARSGR